MNLNEISQNDPQDQSASDVPECRLLVVLHPNTSYITLVLSDRKFNNEQYTTSRVSAPVGPELEMLTYIKTHIVGIDDARAGRNQLKLELDYGALLREFLPKVITAVKQFCLKSDPSYSPTIFCQDDRYQVLPRQIDEWTETSGVKFRPGAVDIGVPYKVWPIPT